MRLQKLLATALLLGLATACGKDVDLSDLARECGGNQIRAWRFVQPEPTIRRELDLLFVVDTSTSLNPERKRVAAALPAFIGELDPETDFRIATLAAHGGASSLSGRIKRVTQSELKTALGTSTADADEAEGEALMYSLSRAIDGNSLAANRAQGFFRETAALGVIFVTDENDVCFPTPTSTATELVAYDRYCAGITPTSVLEKLRTLQNGRPLTLAGVTHVDPAKVPKTPTGVEDSIGHGIHELLAAAPNSVSQDIEQTSYSAGLARMGSMISTELRLRTAFELERADGVRRETVQVEVDGKRVRSQYDSTMKAVTLTPSDAGTSGSIVEVRACDPTL